MILTDLKGSNPFPGAILLANLKYYLVFKPNLLLFMDLFELLNLRGTRKFLEELTEKGAVKYSEPVRVLSFSSTITRTLKRIEQRMVEKRF